MNDMISRHEALGMSFSGAIEEGGIIYVPFREVQQNLQDLPSVLPQSRVKRILDSRIEALEKELSVEAFDYMTKRETWARYRELITVSALLEDSGGDDG